MSIKILIADDDLFVQKELRATFSAAPRLSVAGAVPDGDQAVNFCESTEVDVVVMDAQLPVKDGLQATAEICRHNPVTRVVMFASHYDPATLHGAIEAGASGYILKSEETNTVVFAIEAAASGLKVFSESVHQVLSESYPINPAGADDLTAGEREVLRLLSSGDSNREIARKLHLSESSVKARLSSAASKLGSSSRVETAVRATILKMI